jgi:hypothetical protein
VSAEILNLSDYRVDDGADAEVDLVAVDLATAVDVAIRDLREILQSWGSEIAEERARECELTLRRAYSGFVFGPQRSR